MASASDVTPGSCLSPSSSSSSSSHNEHLLLNERPDTPLMAVKFEDFSSGEICLVMVNDLTWKQPAFDKL